MHNFRMNNVGGSYYDPNKLGYSSVSKHYGQSHRSNVTSMQIKDTTMIIILENFNLCWIMKERNSKRLNKNLKVILITRGKLEFNWRASWSS